MPSSIKLRVEQLSNGAIEFLLIALVILSPWPFASRPAIFEFLLVCGVSIILLLWGLRVLVEGRALFFPTRATMLFAAGLFGLFLMAAVQLYPIPKPALDLLSPQVEEWTTALLPPQREELLNASTPVPKIEGWTAGDRFSLNPSGSYRFALRILTLFGLFLAVCSLSSTKSTLHRISIAAVFSGACLALFSILQFLSSPPNLIYWYFESGTRVFGPFINPNHYPFFANLVLGLSIGLLLHRRDQQGMRWFHLVQDPISLWLLIAIGLITSSVFLSVSRGGIVAMTASIGVCLILRMQKTGRAHAFASLMAVIALVAVLLVWIGFDLMWTKLSWLFEADRYSDEGRWYLWEAAVSTIRQFPLFGSGGETFRYWETMSTSNVSQWNSVSLMALRADNEFLDIGAEYGLIAVLFMILAAASILKHGFQVSRKNALATGALMSLIAVIVHSCFDFGLRMPASAVFAVIVAALLGSIKPPVERGHRTVHRSLEAKSIAKETPPQALASPTLADRAIAILCAATCVLFVTTLIRETRRYAMSDTYRLNSLSNLKEQDFESFLENSQRSVALTPEVGQIRIETARSLFFASELTKNAELKKEWIEMALAHCIVARELTPLAWEPHLWLGRYYSHLKTERPQIDYFQSARRLHPYDPDIAFATGAILFDAGQLEDAWHNWKVALAVSNKYLQTIMQKSRTKLTAEEQIEKIIPRDASTLNQAALIAKKEGHLQDEKTFLQAAVRQLELAPPESQQEKIAARAALAGEMHSKVGDPKAAIESYQMAIRYQPNNSAWRIELIKLLVSERSLEEARRQTRTLLSLEPENNAGLQLREEISRLQTAEKARQ